MKEWVRIAYLVDNIGPYHAARLEALSRQCNLLAIEQRTMSAEYSWERAETSSFQRITLFDDSECRKVDTPTRTKAAVNMALTQFRPDIVLVPGWSSRQAAAGLMWVVRNHSRAIVMSDSQECDARRRALTEWIKKRFVGCCDGGLVAGKTHRKYIEQLGMEPERIEEGYDVVDNDYFVRHAREARRAAGDYRARLDLPERYFLTVGRFVEKKNMEMVISAFAALVHGALDWCEDKEIPRLVMLGDGILRDRLKETAIEHGVEKLVLMPGFKQYGELPIYYALAEAFILASKTEQWGLVINEAMAAGLPVLVSNRCGAASTVVQDGVNGFVFDPHDKDKLSELMGVVFNDKELVRRMGREGKRIIGEWTPESFSDTVMALGRRVQSVRQRRCSMVDRAVLKMLLHRPAVA